MNPVVVNFDGICEPAYEGGPRNPGGCACGGWYVAPNVEVPALSSGTRGGRHYRTGEGATNNLAEYHAALDALRAVYATGYRGPVILRGDSKLVIEQTNGNWACNVEHLQELRDRLLFAITHFAHVRLEWVPRDCNQEADAESRRAYVRQREKVGTRILEDGGAIPRRAS